MGSLVFGNPGNPPNEVHALQNHERQWGFSGVSPGCRGGARLLRSAISPSDEFTVIQDEWSEVWSHFSLPITSLVTGREISEAPLPSPRKRGEADRRHGSAPKDC